MENNEQHIVRIKPGNPYARIARVFIFLLLLFFIAGFIVQISNGKSFTDMLRLYAIAAIIAFAFTILSWFRCKVVVYEVTIQNEFVHIKWKEWAKEKVVSTTLNNVNAKLVEAGRYESNLRITIKQEEGQQKITQCAISGWTVKTMQQFIEDLGTAKKALLQKSREQS